ncbi:nucleoside transporter-domain-containing protein [Flammula alnicola]|nr:nucleoside transporter-domain-containing protein [Flammula alnicola]
MPPSLGSPEALYHAFPQPDNTVNASQIELDVDGEAAEPVLPATDLPTFLVDSRIRWIHFILGCAVLLPWNVVITAMPFFLARLSTSPLRSTFASYLTTSFTASNFIFLAHATATSKTTSPSRQTRSSIAWLIILNFLLTLTTFFVPSPGIFFAFVLFNGSAQAIVGAYLQTSVIAVASLFAVAVAVSGVQVISAAASVWKKPITYASDGSAEERSAFMFFSLSTLFLVVSAAAHTWMVRMPIYGHVAASLEHEPKKTHGEEGHEHERRGLISSELATSLASDRANAFRVGKLNLTYEVAVAYVFVVTLAVYPPITTSIQPTNPTTHPLLFSSIHFLVFNSAISQDDTLSAARTLFIPLFLMCNVQRGSSTLPYDPIISSDFLFMLILFFFGWSNGYVSSLCMMSAPSLEHNPRLKGRRRTFCLVGGLALGSVTSFAVKGAICGCNPLLVRN